MKTVQISLNPIRQSKIICKRDYTGMSSILI